MQRRSLVTELRNKGVRLTAQRLTLIDIIQSADRHLNAEALLATARARGLKLDRATVYRTLDMLKKLGLIDELDLMHVNGEQHYYEIRSGRDHVHMACFGCGAVLEAVSPLYESLKEDLAKSMGFQIKAARLEIGGLCSKCADGVVSRGTVNPKITGMS